MQRRATVLVLLGCLGIIGAPLASADFAKVTIDLNSLATTGDVPFDEPFFLTGNVSPQVKRLSMTYQMISCAPRKKKNDPAPEVQAAAQPVTSPCAVGETPVSSTSSAPESDEQVWERRTADGNAFQFVIGMLEPNACYRIRFKQSVAPAGDPERKELQKALAVELRDALPPYFLTAAKQSEIKKELQQTIDTFVSRKFQACITPKALDEVLSPAILKEVFDVSSMHSTTQGKVDTNRDEMLRELCLKSCGQIPESEWIQFRTTLSALVTDPSSLVPGARTVWALPINSGREGHPATTMAQMAAILSPGSAGTTSLQRIIEGSKKVAGSSVDNSENIDVTSLELLHDFFQIVARSEFARVVKEVSGGVERDVIRPVFSESFRSKHLVVESQLRQLVDSVRDKTANDAAFADPKFPDILADRVLDQVFSVVTTPTLFTKDRNPYIGLDLGIGYLSELSKTFTYSGANFYSVPVNKNAPLSNFHGWKRFRKSSSILIGITNSSFEDTNNGVKNLTSVGSVLLGVGYRFNQVVKVNAGEVAYRQQNANPIINKTLTKYNPFVSISIDIDLKTILGGVSTLF